MIKKTITYSDLNGDNVTEDFYFNLTRAELLEMEITAEGNSLQDYLKRITQEQDAKKLMNVFKEVIGKAYGVRSLDGKRFIKSQEASDAFFTSEAWSELFIEFFTDAAKAAEFFKALAPKNLESVNPQSSEDIRRASEAQMQGFKRPEEKTLQVVNDAPNIIVGDPQPGQDAPPAQVTEKDLVNMSNEQLQALVRQRGLTDAFQNPGMSL